MKKFFLILCLLSVSACGAKTYQLTDKTPNGDESVTIRSGVGYENTTIIRDSTHAYRDCMRREHDDNYCRCVATPAEKRGTECGYYGYGGYGMNAGGFNGGFDFRRFSNVDGSSMDPRYQAEQPERRSAKKSPESDSADSSKYATKHDLAETMNQTIINTGKIVKIENALAGATKSKSAETTTASIDPPPPDGYEKK
jgi:opacity protein-like surface antigen